MSEGRAETLWEVAHRAQSHKDFWIYFGDFLDSFYARPNANALQDEPPRLETRFKDGAWLDGYLAATAEHLARQSALPFPAWTQEASRILREPYFAFESYEDRMFLLVESPTAFRARNIFVSADALSRV